MNAAEAVAFFMASESRARLGNYRPAARTDGFVRLEGGQVIWVMILPCNGLPVETARENAPTVGSNCAETTPSWL
jgi:hypothetical protein